MAVRLLLHRQCRWMLNLSKERLLAKVELEFMAEWKPSLKGRMKVIRE